MFKVTNAGGAPVASLCAGGVYQISVSSPRAVPAAHPPSASLRLPMLPMLNSPPRQPSSHPLPHLAPLSRGTCRRFVMPSPAAEGRPVPCICMTVTPHLHPLRPGGLPRQVSFPEARNLLLTASAGRLEGGAYVGGDECAVRLITQEEQPAFNFTYTAPPVVSAGNATAGATADAQLRVTSATGKHGAFQQASLVLTVRPSDACHEAPAAAAAATAGAADAAAGASGDRLPGPGCQPSPLGYQCMYVAAPDGSGATIHFSSGVAHPPANPCTEGTVAQGPNAEGAGASTMLHFAVQHSLPVGGGGRHGWNSRAAARMRRVCGCAPVPQDDRLL